MYAHIMLLAFQMKLCIHGYNNSVIGLLSRCSRDLDICQKNPNKEIYMNVHIIYIFS